MVDVLPQMDVSGPKSQLREKWRVWLRGFTYYAEGKVNLSNAARRRNELFYRAGSGVQDIYENLVPVPRPVGLAGSDDVYQECVRTLNAYFHVEENVAYERHALRQLKQEPGEDVDAFVLRLKKQARHCGYAPEELDAAVRDQLLEKVSSQELRTKLFEVSNIQLQEAVTKARAWEVARRQAASIAGSVGPESGAINALKVEGKSNFGARGNRGGRGPRGGKHAKSGSRKEDSSGSRCYACGRPGHFARDKECPARGKNCARCGKKGHWANCCRMKREAEVRQVQREGDNASEWDDDSYAFTVSSGGPGNENVLPVKLNGISVEMLVDSGAQSTVLGEKQFEFLRQQGLEAELVPDNRKLRVYGNSLLPVVGVFHAVIMSYGRCVDEEVLVTQGDGQCLLGNQAAKRLQVLKVGRMSEVGVPANSVATSIPDQFPKVFSGIGKLSGYQLSLHINPAVTPVAQKPRKIPFPLKDKVMKKVDELLTLDVIEKVNGPTSWVSPAVFVPKPGKDDIRLCVDMRCANKAILREKLPIPTVDDVLEELNGSTVYSKLDMNLGFHQIELHEDSRDITTFAVGDCLYRYKRLSFGINSAPEKYQSIIRQTIADIPGVTNIADDIIVHGKDVREHDLSLMKLLRRLEERNLTLKREKCLFQMDRVVFMGLLLTKYGVGPTEEKVRAVRESQTPTNVSQVRSFLGLVGFSSRFLPDLATTSEPLRKLTRLGTEWHWGPEEDQAFNTLKNQLADASLLAFFDKDAPTEVVTDASPVGLGAVLVQQQGGVKRAVCLASRTLSDVERRYSQVEKEALAVVWACERFHLYLHGLETFELVTDCKALEAIYGPKSKPSARVERWVLRLMPYQFTVRCVSSGQNIADCLSRLTQVSASSHHGRLADEYVRMVAYNATPRALKTSEMEKASTDDEELTKVRECWRSGNWSSAPAGFKMVREEITVIGKLVLRGTRIVVPTKLRRQVLELAHEGHPGIVKMKDRLRSKVWWPAISNMAETHCRSCHACQAVTRSDTTPPVKSTCMPTQPWRHLATDLMGPLPSGESLLVLVDYYSRWMEVDVLTNTSSRTVITCLEKHFARYGIPESLRTDNAANLVSQEMEEFLAEHGVHHRRTIPYWPRANGEIERQNRTLLKAMRAAQVEKKSWSQELQKFLMAYRSTPHSTTGVSPAKLLIGRQIRTKLPEFEGEADGCHVLGTTDQAARDSDAENKQRVQDRANKGTSDSNLKEGEKVLLWQQGHHKLSPVYDPDPFVVLARKGDLIVIERGNTLLKRNLAHVKRFLESHPAEPLPSHPVVKSRQQFDPPQQQFNPQQQFDPPQPSTEALPESELNLRQHHSVMLPRSSVVLSPPSVALPPEVLPRSTVNQPVPASVNSPGAIPRRSSRIKSPPVWSKDYT